MIDARPAEWRRLADWCAGYGVRLAASQLDQLRIYLDVLQVWNRKLALVAQTDMRQIMAKHFADSLFVASLCLPGNSLVDLGSGAGFPGLPIAIARPASRACLIESRGKKASFLEEVCRAAAVRNVDVLNMRIETVATQVNHRDCYAVATGRALTDSARFFALATRFLEPGGRAVAMRSVGEQDPALSDLEEIRYELPDGTPRRLLVARR